MPISPLQTTQTPVQQTADQGPPTQTTDVTQTTPIAQPPPLPEPVQIGAWRTILGNFDAVHAVRPANQWCFRLIALQQAAANPALPQDVRDACDFIAKNPSFFAAVDAGYAVAVGKPAWKDGAIAWQDINWYLQTNAPPPPVVAPPVKVDTKTPWAYPLEISVADAFNHSFGTEFDGKHVEGLQALVAKHGVPMTSTFTVQSLAMIDVLVNDTSAMAPLSLKVGDTMIPIYQPTPWQAPSRGWLPDAGVKTIDVAQALKNAGFDPACTEFSLAVGQIVMDASNTYKLSAPTGPEVVLAFNGNGVTDGDADANEPVLRCRPAEQSPVQR